MACKVCDWFMTTYTGPFTEMTICFGPYRHDHFECLEHIKDQMSSADYKWIITNSVKDNNLEVVDIFAEEDNATDLYMAAIFYNRMNIFTSLRTDYKLSYSYDIKEFINNVKSGTLPAHMTDNAAQMTKFCKYIEDTWRADIDGKKDIYVGSSRKLRFD